MIEAFAVKLPAFVFTWDGTEADAQAITDTLRENLDDPSLYSAGYTYSTEFGARFSLSIEEGSEMGHQLYMRPGDSATVIVDPESRCAIAVFERATSRDTIVLQEGAPRAIGP